MIYRLFKNIHLSLLTFGTSTFVSGKLFPNKHSQEGIDSLKLSLSKGINSIHSNPKLKTQWAVKDIADTKNKNHFIKVETPLNKSFKIDEYFNNKIDESLINLDIKNVKGIIHEVDIKNTQNKADLHSHIFLLEHFKHINYAFKKRFSNNTETFLIEMVNNPSHMEAALRFNFFDGFAGYFNLLNNWCSVYFEDIKSINKHFIGLRPFAYNQVFEPDCKLEFSNVFNDHSAFIKHNNLSLADIALLFSIFHPVISTTITGMSKLNHVNQNIDIIERIIETDWLKDINEALLK